MADPLALTNREAIEERAADWLIRRDSDRFGEAQERELRDWLSRSPHHSVAYYRLETAWAAADRLKVLGAGPSRQATPVRTRIRTRLVPYMAAAASVLLTLGLFHAFNDQAFHGYRYSTPIGGMTTLPMADGSWVTLNTDSAIRISLTPKIRRVSLDRGEAFFIVAKDRNRPFVVDANDKSVTAVGTEFAVRKDGATTRVTVAEGRVRFATIASKTATPIAAGEIAEVRGRDSIVVKAEPLSQVMGTLSWRQGLVVFHDTPLTEAVSDLNRYNAKKIRILDPSAAAIQICGAIRTDNVDGFIRLMKDDVELGTTETPMLVANEPPVRSINVSAGDLAAALEEMVQGQRLQVLYRCEGLKGIQTAGASGYFTGPQALEKLIQGTQLTLRADSTGASFVAAPLKHFLGPY